MSDDLEQQMKLRVMTIKVDKALVDFADDPRTSRLKCVLVELSLMLSRAAAYILREVRYDFTALGIGHRDCGSEHVDGIECYVDEFTVPEVLLDLNAVENQEKAE
jgi:hypothetical protein